MDIGVGIVRGYLRFTEIIAVRTAADGKQGGRLYALGNGKSCKQIPPFFQIGDKIVIQEFPVSLPDNFYCTR